MKSFKSRLRINYLSDLGMFSINGESLTRRNTVGLNFYDKKEAIYFKNKIDNEDFYFYHDNKLKS